MTSSDRNRLPNSQLMELAYKGAVLSPEDLARLTGSQLMDLFEKGLVITREIRDRLAPSQLAEVMRAELIPFASTTMGRCRTSKIMAFILDEVESNSSFHEWDTRAVVLHLAAVVTEFNGTDVERILERVQKDPTEARDIVVRLVEEGILRQKILRNVGYVLFMDRKDREEYKKRLQNSKTTSSAEVEPEQAQVSLTLEELASSVTDSKQNAFLQEALSCLKVGAYRAAIVMGWNLAYDHLLRWLLDDEARLREFNGKLTLRTMKKSVKYDAVAEYEDFSGIKESIVIEECVKAGLLPDAKDQLREGLNKRNRYAHPNSAAVTAPIAAGHIDDLLQHIVLSPRFAISAS